MYFSDPRLQYLAYAGIIGRESSLYGTGREHYFAPRMKDRQEAEEWLRKFGLYGEFSAKASPDEDFYEKFARAYKSLKAARRGRQLI